MKSFLLLYILVLPNGAYIEAEGELLRAEGLAQCQVVAREKADAILADIRRDPDDGVFFADVQVRCEKMGRRN